MTAPPDPAEAAVRAAFTRDGASRDLLVAAAECYLLAIFPGLVGLEQLWAHYHPGIGRTTDPLEHTLEVFAELDLEGLAERDRRTLLWATLFHDVGKVRDPHSRAHARVSVDLARGPLERMEDDAGVRHDALRLVATHDLLGHFMQGHIDAQDLLGALDWDARLLELHLRLAGADIRSIRGLRDIVPPSRLRAARLALERALAQAAEPGGRAGGP